MRIYFILIITLTALDQAVKAWASQFLAFKPLGYDVLPVFQLYLVKNTGISFSLFSSDLQWAKWALIGMSSLLCLLLIIWLKQSQSKLSKTGISFVIGGALGNIIDRVLQGGVIDFISLHYGQYTFPTFNLADIFIFLGVIIILYEDMVAKKP